MAGISDKAIKSNYAENKYRANDGSELQNKEFSDGTGLEGYDASFRMYDPQIGRFWQIDPWGELSESYSLYSFCLDNPISFVDPLGLTPDSLPAVVVTPGQNTGTHLAKITPDAPPTIKVDPPPSEVPAPIDAPAPATEPTPDVPPPASVGPALALTAVFVAIPITGNTNWPNGEELFYQHHPELSPEARKPVTGNKPLDDLYLVRYGDGPESKEKLGAEANKAQNFGFPHGVSTVIRAKAPPYGKAAKLLEVMRRFEIQKTGNKPDHFTVVLPNPVTQQVADEFNSLFTNK
jgi:RHS repeat-associated protein